MADTGRKTYELLMRIAGKVDTSLTSAMNQTKSSLESVQSSASSLTSGLMKLAGLFGAGMAIKGLTLALDDLADKGDTAAKAARTLGMDVAAMQEMAYAFGQEGVEGFTDKVETMRKTLIQAAAGQGKAVKILEEYGLSAEKLSQMAPEQAIERLSDFMRQQAVSAEDASRLAIAIFGAEGQDMARIMTELGSSGIQALREEARMTGSIMSAELTKQAEKYQDAKSKLAATVEGIRVSVFGPLLPKITGIFDDISSRIMGSGEGVAAFGERIAAKFDEMYPKIIDLAEQAYLFVKMVWQGADAVAQFLGGWGNVIKTAGIAIVALKSVGVIIAGIKFAGMIQGLGTVFVTAKSLGGVFYGLKTTASAAMAAMGMNPVVLGIMAVVAALALIVMNWGRIKETAGKALDYVKDKTALAKDWMSEKWQNVKDAAVSAWERTKTAAASAWMGIKESWAGQVVSSYFGMIFDNIRLAASIPLALLRGDFSGAYESVTKIWENIKKFFSDAWDSLPNGLKAAVDKVLGFFAPLTDLLGGIKEKASSLFGGVGEKVKGLFGGNDKTPGFATGGYVHKPTFAKVAESVPEWIIPSDGSKRSFDLWQAAGAQFKDVLSDLTGGSPQAMSDPFGSARPGAGINVARMRTEASGGITINYSPVLNFTGTNQEMQNNVEQQLQRHADDLEARLKELEANRRRLRFSM